MYHFRELIQCIIVKNRLKCISIYIYISHACESRIFCLYTVKYYVKYIVGESSNGRTADFDSVSLGSNPSSPKYMITMLLRDRETVSRWAHNPKTGGSTPSPATKKKQCKEIYFGRFWILIRRQRWPAPLKRGSLHLPQPKERN